MALEKHWQQPVWMDKNYLCADSCCQWLRQGAQQHWSCSHRTLLWLTVWPWSCSLETWASWHDDCLCNELLPETDRGLKKKQLIYLRQLLSTDDSLSNAPANHNKPRGYFVQVWILTTGTAQQVEHFTIEPTETTVIWVKDEGQDL